MWSTAAPHKPLLRLWLFGRLAATGSRRDLHRGGRAGQPPINDFGPPVASPVAARRRAALPLIHLEREQWQVRDAAGNEIGPDAPPSRGWLAERGALGPAAPGGGVHPPLVAQLSF
jgi:putative restriction endonuclease